MAASQGFTNGDMPTVVIDGAGNLKAINNAFQYLAHGGRYILAGLQKETSVLVTLNFINADLLLMSSRNAAGTDFDHELTSMPVQLVDPVTYITYRSGLTE